MTKEEMKTYKKTATVQAKLFEKGDEDGFARLPFGTKEKPYISTLENRQHFGEFGQHYLCIGIKDERWLVEKEIFEQTYELSQLKPQEGEWISVKDKLPEDKKWVMYFDPELTYSTGRIQWCFGSYFKDEKYWESDGLISKTVTHWMPRPPPPKG